MKAYLAITTFILSGLGSCRHSYVYEGSQRIERTIQARDNSTLVASVSAPLSVEWNGWKGQLRVNISEKASGVQKTWDYSWPGTANVNATFPGLIGSANARADALCFLAVHADFPKDVVDAYDPRQPGSCDGPFGNACSVAISSAMPAFFAGDECPTLHISTIPECKSVFGGISSISQSTERVTRTYQKGNPILTLDGARSQLKSELKTLQVAVLTAYDLSGRSSSSFEPMCLVAKPATSSPATVSSTTKPTQIVDNAGPTVMPGIGAAALAGLGVVAGLI